MPNSKGLLITVFLNGIVIDTQIKDNLGKK